jgi:uncharacterized protein HemX
MGYDQQHISKLVELFWSGESNTDQEKELHSLSLESVRFQVDYPELHAYLDSIREYKTIDTPNNLSQTILNKTTRKKNNTLKPVTWFLGIAATLALVLWILPAQQNPDYTDEEVQQAYNETKQALFLLSSKMEKGNNYVLKLGEFDKNQKKLKQKTTKNNSK